VRKKSFWRSFSAHSRIDFDGFRSTFESALCQKAVRRTARLDGVCAATLRHSHCLRAAPCSRPASQRISRAKPDRLLAIRLSRTITIAALVEELKTSSKWLKTQSPKLSGFAWQRGCGVCSAGPADLAALLAYIDNQDKHHQTRSCCPETWGVAPGWYGSGALALVFRETSVGRRRVCGYGCAGISAMRVKAGKRAARRFERLQAVLAGRGEWLFHCNELQRSHARPEARTVQSAP